MISAITGQPAIIIEGLNEFNLEIGNNNTTEGNIVNSKSTDSINNNNEPESNKSAKKEEKGKQVSYEELQSKIQDTLKDSNLMIEFSKDKELNKMIIKIVDSTTKEIVRQIPPDVELKVARIISQTFGTGQIADAKV